MINKVEQNKYIILGGLFQLITCCGFAITLTRGPYLQNLKPDSVIIVWRTDEAADGEVHFGLTPACEQIATETTTVLQHAVTLTGLEPAKEYFYNVKSGGQVLAENLTFRSGKDASFNSFTFVAMGDHRSQPVPHTAVAQRIKAIDPEIIIETGDLTADGDIYHLWDTEFFTPEKDVLPRSCLFPAIGNHEHSMSNYLDIFYLPTESSGTERYYSFDYANAHFIMLDTTINFLPGSAEHNWLKSDLEANRLKKWIFAVCHYPPYSSCAVRGSDLNVRGAFSTLFEQYGVDIVFSGHNHGYERSWVNSVYYIVTAGGGAPLYPNGYNFWTQFSASEYHCCKITIRDDILEGEAILPDGTVLDSF